MPKARARKRCSGEAKQRRAKSVGKSSACSKSQVSEDVLRHLEETFEPLNDWLAEMSKEWSERYSGKYLGIIEVGHCKFKLAFVVDSWGEAFERFKREYPDQIPNIVYVPKPEEMEMVLCQGINEL